MIGNAHMIYAEIVQSNELALKHKRNCEFWKTLREVLLDERPQYENQRQWKREFHRASKMLKRNERSVKKIKNHVENLKYQYRHLTGKEHGEHDEG